jgi:hypothetical protein
LEDEKCSTVYDHEYFDSRRSPKRPDLITHVCVFSIVVHGPYGLMRNGLRDFFREVLHEHIHPGGSVRWSRTGSKLRVILTNFEEEQKAGVEAVLCKLVAEGSEFTFSEKLDEVFATDPDDSELQRWADPSAAVVSLRRERSRSSTMTSEGDQCANDKCHVSYGIDKLCKKCKRVKYCSRRCLKDDADKHKLLCHPASPAKNASTSYR